MSREGESPLGNQIDEVARFDLGANRLLSLSAFRRLQQLVDQEGIDLVHAQLQYATVFGGLLRQRTGIPMVVTRHLITDDEHHWRERARNWVERWIIRRYASCVVTVSDAAQDYYAKLVKLPPERFQTIYNGINLEAVQQPVDKQSLREKLGLPTDRPIIMMVGVMRPGKGHNVLIEASRQINDAWFVLVGDGSERERLMEQAADLEDRVRFLGQRMDVAELLRAADIFALPSDSEALPTVLIEAGAAGLPSVASRVGGCPEVVIDGEGGIIIPPRNPQALAAALRDLLDHPDKAHQMGKKAFQRVQSTFTLSQQANDLMALYEHIAKNPSV
jgi:glycosyltransferase involved in cell wall biosynthesis